MKLTQSNMLGNWKGTNAFICEFQIGSMLVFVEYSQEREKEHQLTHANELISELLETKEEAIELGIRISQTRNPSFWLPLEGCFLKQDVLTIFSIRFPSGKKEPIYEISWNPQFREETVYHEDDYFKDEPIKVVELPDDEEFINILRTKSGKLMPAT